MTSITGVSFDDAWADRVTGDLDGLRVQIIGRRSLLRNKDATGRAKDRIDAEELRKRSRRASGERLGFVHLLVRVSAA